ncbi:17247_t:CDS:2, partial [Entrophospora sp. SA101]
AQEIPVNTDFSLFSQENSSIVDLPLSSPELSDDNEIANVNFSEDNNAGYYTGTALRTIRYKKQKLCEAAEGTANIMDFFKPVSNDDDVAELYGKGDIMLDVFVDGLKYV